MPRPELRRTDETLFAVNDLVIAFPTLLQPCEDWQVSYVAFTRLVPGRLRRFLKQRLLQIIGTTTCFCLDLDNKHAPKGQLALPGIIKDQRWEPTGRETTQIELITEMADLIFQCMMPDKLRYKYFLALRAQSLPEYAGYVLLAIWLKELAEEGKMALLWQQGSRIIWRSDNNLMRIMKAA